MTVESSAVVLDDIIYLIGGALETGEESGNVFALEPNSNYWEWVGALALPRSGHIAAPVPGTGQIVIQGNHGVKILNPLELRWPRTPL